MKRLADAAWKARPAMAPSFTGPAFNSGCTGFWCCCSFSSVPPWACCLVILPWRPEWTDNYFLLASPGLRTFVSNGFVRGLCSGLGLLDIWIGFWEAVHFHDETRP